ncbi:hypothetical protein GQ53DRAFT_785643 [Thozetella sp. PMI_491]|nr:hypothetical protein GQ53DRAFT_785643 [Thozetella sp. PMI_491]
MPEVDTLEERLTNPKLQGRFQENPDPDRVLLGRAWELLEGYSNIPEDQIEPHVKAVRDKAWAIFPYGCIGRWRFLDLYLPGTPQYPGILQRIKDGETFLDCGCCFGQALRQLAFDGAPTENLYGCDLRQEFLDLGYDLFKDRDTFKGTFVAGDMLDPDNTSLKVLDGKLNIIHAASFFHLFGWEDQVDIGARIIRFFKPGAKNATLIGRQIGKYDPVDPEVHAQRGLGRYHHNPESLQKLWDEIGVKTGTKWKVEMAVLEESPVHGLILNSILVQVPGAPTLRLM